MADETVGVSDKEQVAVCIRWVDENLCVHEDFTLGGWMRIYVSMKILH